MLCCPTALTWKRFWHITMEVCPGEGCPSSFVGQEFSETYNNVGAQDYYRNGVAGIKILWVGGTWLFVVSLGPWGRYRGFYIKIYSKRTRSDLTGMGPKKGWRVWLREFRCVMVEEWVIWWDHPGKDALLLIWVVSSDTDFVTSGDEDTRGQNCWFLNDF